MDDKLSCPYCGSSAVQLLEGRYAIRIVERPEGGPARQRKCSVSRCLDCGHTFDDIEAEEDILKVTFSD